MTAVDPEVLITNEDADGTPIADPFLSRLARAAALYDERRLPEAENELHEAARLRPDDARPHRLLARVRVRLGRLADAQRSFATLVALAPTDAQAHFELGLLALKADNHALAVTELAEALRLSPYDARAQEYLGVAWRRLGRAAAPVASPAADVASPPGAPLPAAWPTRPPAGLPWPTEMALADLAAARMLPPESGADAGGLHVGAGVLRLAVEPDAAAFVAPAALLALIGDVVAAPAPRRRSGGVAEVGDDEPSDPGRDLGGNVAATRSPWFLRCAGQGDVWIGGGRRGRAALGLRLENDALFVRASRVLAFSGTLGWDAGRLPLGGAGGPAVPPSSDDRATDLPSVTLGTVVLHFHGRGHIVVDWAPDDVVSLRVSAAAPAKVPAKRLLGWLGQVVLHPQTEWGGVPGPHQLITCEGEGVLLIARDGQAQQPIHQRAEPGDHGAGGADSPDPDLHR